MSEGDEEVPSFGSCDIHKGCPACQGTPLLLRWGWEFSPIGTFSLAGEQMKVPGRHIARISCGACGWSAAGRLSDDARVENGRFVSGHFEQLRDA